MPHSKNIDSPQTEHAEAALRLSEATKSAILETALDCIVTIDHNGYVVDWNPAAERTFGYSRQEALGREMSELIIPPALQPLHHAGLSRAVATGHNALAAKRVELTARRKNGEEIPVELAITRVAAKPHPLFTGHIRDISERKQIEQRQAAQYAVARVLAEAGSLAEAAPKIIRAVCESLKWDLGTLWKVDQAANALTCVDVWHSDVVSAGNFEKDTRRSHLARGVGLPGLIWETGEARWIPDVVRHPNFPRAPFAARDNLHAAFGFPIRLDGKVLGVIEFFSHEIRQPNADVMAMFGAIGSQIGQFIERKQAETNLRQLNQDLEQRVNERTLELTQAKQELVKALEQEKELSHLKSSFVNLVSHEFRTPLGVILSSSDILESYFDRLRPEQRRDHLQDIRHATRQMSSLMEEVLLLGRVEAGKMECSPAETDLVEFCQRVLDEQASATNRKCALKFTLGKVPRRATADESLLRHIFANLLSNAVKYSPAGGEVHFSLTRDGGNAIFEVRDSGIGIPIEDQRHLFEAFHRAQNVGEIPGTGLGLVIVKRCVDLHGGRIEFSSTAGQGATFVVRLPLFSEKKNDKPSRSGKQRKKYPREFAAKKS
jgi:PAS domain S-box-containing protein